MDKVRGHVRAGEPPTTTADTITVRELVTGTDEETTVRWKNLIATEATGGAIMVGMPDSLHQDHNKETSRPVARSRVTARIGVGREVERGTHRAARPGRMA